MIPTYEPGAPDPNPMFLEKRVYQGSSGRVYPLPFIGRIAEEPTPRAWDAITVDNGLVEVMLLPEIGGRIHAIRDLSNGFDAIYRQHVIKPALVGLAGPWASGGVEFNWPQHHRPSTFMPTDVAIEHGDDGSVAVWMGEHEPMDRTKGMHGVCLHPGRSVVELKVRLYNRTPYVQTFLWWSNIGVSVDQGYKSFFPPDARVVADHAKRALSRYPLCDDHYYGVDYGARGRDGVPAEERPAHFLPRNQGGDAGPEYAPNALSWYANIPVPTSYMCMGTKDDFVGGYDHFKAAGLMHLADRHIAPGKKQWTWGNHEFGYAWDRNLTDEDGPYIELMAGVYTDNQPDFSWIAPGETKTFSQFFFAYQAIGPVHAANIDAAISVTDAQIGVAVTRPLRGLVDAGEVGRWEVDLAPDRPFVQAVAGATRVALYEGEREILRFEPADLEEPSIPPTATEPALPAEVASNDELFLIGQHLWQYRHATRMPEDYWREALRRDPGDARCNNAMGLWHLRRGEFEEARERFDASIGRATRRNPNPYDGEAYYNLGLSLRFLGRDDEAIDAFGKAVWSHAWQAAGYHALGELACKRGDLTKTLDYLNLSVRKDADNLRARDLRVVILRKLGREAPLDEILALDPLDWWARLLAGEAVRVDNAVRIDLAIDMARAGLYDEALTLLSGADRLATDGTAPMIGYYEAYLLKLKGQDATEAYSRAAAASPDYCFPARLDDIAVLESAPEEDVRAAFYLGNLLYDRRRHREAIALWERATDSPVALRNLGIATFNVLGEPERARAAYDRAVLAAPDDGRLRYERDQLLKRIGIPPEERLSGLSGRIDLVNGRDDLTLEFVGLLNAVGRHAEAAEMLDRRRFQPWEGGEGMALGAFSRTHLALGRQALANGDAAGAKAHFLRIQSPPQNLGEARHLLANASDLWLALGDAHAALGEEAEACRWWSRAADFRGDFQEMSVREFSELTAFQAQAMERLGRGEDARRKLRDLETYAEELARTPAKIDYFATSLPTMLLFDDDLQARQENTARFLKAQAAAGLERPDEARSLVDEVLRHDPNHALAHDLRRTLPTSMVNLR